MTRLLRSLSFRLALTYVGIFSLSVAALSAAYYWISIAAPFNDVKRLVDREANVLAGVYIVDGAPALAAALSRRAAETGARKPFHAFIDEKGHVVSSNLPSWPKEAGPDFIEIEADFYRDGDEDDHHALSRDRVFRDGARLIVGRDAEDIDDRREQLASAAMWIFGVTSVLGVIGGLAMSGAIGRRIEAINRAARTVIDGDLTGRVPTTGAGDDFDRLGETLNLMLGRIELLFDSVRRVSDSVAHELRTPLARLLAVLDRLETIDGDAETRRRLAAEAASEARRLNKIFDAVLRIARIESGRHATGVRSVDLGAIAADAAEFFAPDSERRSIALKTEIAGNLQATADPDLVFQALANLIDNALKFTPPGGAVVIGATAQSGAVTLSVADNGPGVAAADHARLTERFYRGSGAEAAPGEGLGLSLVEAVASRHHAELVFKDNDPGLRVEIRFPRRKKADLADAAADPTNKG